MTSGLLLCFAIFEVMAADVCYYGHELFHPCDCSYDKYDWGRKFPLLLCNGNINLEEVFQRFSQKLTPNEKNFSSLHLSHNQIPVLKDNTFKDITFDLIWLDMDSKLTKIEKNAFNGTSTLTSQLLLTGLPLLNFTNFFQVASQFSNLHYITITQSDVAKSDINAFKPINPDKFFSLEIDGDKVPISG